uniref:Uncharacterized protein n=1 Tax=Romanomermis culicivorax TaxID=13658 RepID=A0A915I070_ROMCU
MKTVTRKNEQHRESGKKEREKCEKEQKRKNQERLKAKTKMINNEEKSQKVICGPKFLRAAKKCAHFLAHCGQLRLRLEAATTTQFMQSKPGKPHLDRTVPHFTISILFIVPEDKFLSLL